MPIHLDVHRLMSDFACHTRKDMPPRLRASATL